ncbi:MAG: hypothetical protein QOJ97_289 [Solirubrobacteraceae bacterium]|nr:hypothetical protein [Solirubrobacteraceae bacterium]
MTRTIIVATSLLGAAYAAAPAAAAVPKACRYLDGARGLLPFPNDAFTVADRRSPTGRRVRISTTCTPRNKDGKAIDTADQNRLDGFSPGSQLVLQVPGLANDAAFRRSGLAPITDIGASLKRTAPIVIFDAKTLKPMAHWAELDANATTDAARMLLVHPARNLLEGHRYVVVVRGLRKATGGRIGPAAGLARARTRDPKVRALLALAARARVSTASLHTIWDFTVGSQTSLETRTLSMRNDAFRQLGDTNLRDLRVAGSAPAFQVSGVTDFTPAENPNILRRVTGTFTVPCYLTTAGCTPGGRFSLDSAGRPRRTAGNVQAATFTCVIPRAAAGGPGRAALYGHGLLGNSDPEVQSLHVALMANEHNFTFCATNWTGFDSVALNNVVGVIGDFGRFPEIADSLQQGFVNFMYLGRLMRHAQGFAANPAFQVGGRPAFDTSALYYDGNSQGGIMGGALTAVAPDFQRAVLGVPGMNFSLLLTRSSNWKTYRIPFNVAYPDEASRPLILSLVQLLWDRGETDGWAAHMTTSPPPGTPSHTVLMHVARGDHQVAPAAAEIEARTNGASTPRSTYAPGTSHDKVPMWGIPRIARFPFSGSAIVVWEPGGGLARVPDQPLTNIPEHPGVDPHGDIRFTVAARRQKAAFLAPNGMVIDVCGGTWCQAEKDPARP